MQTATAPNQPPDPSKLPGREAGRLRRLLCSSSLFYYTLLWLIVLLVVGTLAQPDMGLYLAQQKYFSSWCIWAGLIPLPGGRFTMAVMFFNLLFKITLDPPRSFKKSGVLICHLGSLLLLAGGFITAYGSVEGSMVIPEGGSTSFFEEYHAMELAVIDMSHEDYNQVVAFHGPNLRAGAVIRDPSFPGSIRVTRFYPNCRIIPRSGPAPAGYKGEAQRFVLESAPLEKDEQRIRAGAMIEIDGLDEATNGVYLIYQYMQAPLSLTMDRSLVTLVLRHRRHMLPFEIELVDFKRENHPGTEIARSYSSEVYVKDGGAKWRADIWMNHPLRNRGYTFYQASFIEGGAREATVLAVVRNFGRHFPYIASLVICAGLLLHLLIRLPGLIGKNVEA